MLSPGYPWVPLKQISQIGSAVRPAIAYILGVSEKSVFRPIKHRNIVLKTASSRYNSHIWGGRR